MPASIRSLLPCRATFAPVFVGLPALSLLQGVPAPFGALELAAEDARQTPARTLIGETEALPLTGAMVTTGIAPASMNWSGVVLTPTNAAPAGGMLVIRRPPAATLPVVGVR